MRVSPGERQQAVLRVRRRGVDPRREEASVAPERWRVLLDDLLRERTAETVTRWLALLADEAHAARPDLSAEGARDLATALNGIAMSANQEIQLLADPAAGPRARRAMHAAVVAFAAQAR
jgi:hypothetical protein